MYIKIQCRMILVTFSGEGGGTHLMRQNIWYLLQIQWHPVAHTCDWNQSMQLGKKNDRS